MNGSTTRKVFLVVIMLVTLGLGAAAIYLGYTLSQEGESQAPEETSASSNWTTLLATNNCQSGGCTCNQSGGCQINWYRCDDKYPLPSGAADSTAVQPCLDGVTYAGNMDNGEVASYQQLMGDDSVKCTYVQIDLDPVGGTAGNGLAGTAVIVWNNNTACLKPCSYKSTEALVKASSSSDWESSLDVTCGDSVTIGSSHDQDTSSYPSNTKLTLELPDATKVDVTNGESVATTVEGTYTVTVQTMRANGTTPYTEAKCKATTSFTCTSASLSCGDACTSDTDCEDSGTICNTTDVNDTRYTANTCILETCTASTATCSSTGCSVTTPTTPTSLPSTAIIDDRSDTIIAAISLVVVGLLLVKFDMHNIARRTIKQTIEGLQTGKFAYLTAPLSDKARKELTDKKKKKFEDKIFRK